MKYLLMSIMAKRRIRHGSIIFEVNLNKEGIIFFTRSCDHCCPDSHGHGNAVVSFSLLTMEV